MKLNKVANPDSKHPKAVGRTLVVARIQLDVTQSKRIYDTAHNCDILPVSANSGIPAFGEPFVMPTLER